MYPTLMNKPIRLFLIEKLIRLAWRLCSRDYIAFRAISITALPPENVYE